MRLNAGKRTAAIRTAAKRTAAIRTAAQRTRLKGTWLIGMRLNGMTPSKLEGLREDGWTVWGIISERRDCRGEDVCNRAQSCQHWKSKTWAFVHAMRVEQRGRVARSEVPNGRVVRGSSLGNWRKKIDCRWCNQNYPGAFLWEKNNSNPEQLRFFRSGWQLWRAKWRRMSSTPHKSGNKMKRRKEDAKVTKAIKW